MVNIILKISKMIVCMNCKMLEYDIDISEGIDINKTSASKKCHLSLMVFFRQKL